MERSLFLFYLFTCKNIHPSMFQMPGVVKVPLGGTATLQCNVESIMATCSQILWNKVHPRTRELKTAQAVKTEQREKNLCTGVIQNATVGDSGIYYCIALSSIILYIGNGSKVIVTEPNTKPTITLYTPDENQGSSMALQCLVFGVVPDETRVFWVVGQTTQTGWTESGWTDNTESASEFTWSYLTLSSDIWMDDVQIECIVELGGKNFSKSLKRGSNNKCTWILYLGSGSALLIISWVVIGTISLNKVKKVQLQDLLARNHKADIRMGDAGHPLQRHRP
ncbi:uncharacterized protein LOC118241895 isoform X2 [Electrophorus electricus]|uniref:uncharacterized protein LOC118241895 isoform X2 n=1 Tax=Electrophorus electricus TaxID=8005 RepID=UPI0015D00F72|nr:uncharacterized protein LOC118241895 isoform X2 [Electrophorus electricus]